MSRLAAWWRLSALAGHGQLRGVLWDALAAVAILARAILAGVLLDAALRGSMAGLLWSGGALTLTWLLRAGCGAARERAVASATQRLLTVLYRRMAAAALDLSSEARNAAEDGLRLPGELALAGLRALLGAALLTALHPGFLIALLPALGVGVVIARAARQRALPATQAARSAFAELAGRCAALPAATQALELPAVRRRWQTGLRDLATQWQHHEHAAGDASAWWGPLASLVLALTVAATIAIGAGVVGPDGLSAGDLTSAVFLVILALGPAIELAQLGQRWVAAAVAMDRLAPLLSRPTAPARRFPSYPQAPLCAEDISIGWEGGRPLLSSWSCALASGDRLLVHGPSGCGKSTLLRSLAGEQAVLGGTLRRGRTVLVRQDAVPLPGPVLATLRRVAAAHGAACSATDIRSFAERLGLAVPLAALPAGWDTVCEPGVALPPGCDQALCLLAAALARPDLLLLDEATAMFDQATAATIVAGLATLPGAIIASAHRGGAYTGWPRLDLAQPIARIELPTSACIATMLVPMKATMAGMPA